MKTSELIKSFYINEMDSVEDEVMNAKITVKCSLDSAAMFNAIASRFNVSRFTLLEDVLNNAAKEMFKELSEGDRNSLSKAADKDATEQMFKNGVTSITSGGAGGPYPENESCAWQSQAAMILLVEAKERGEK